MTDNIPNDGEVYSPEELAWQLIMDENISPRTLMTFADENSKEIMFEILVTIYLEMIFDYYKLKYLENTTDNDDDIINAYDNFKLDLTNVNVDMLTDIFFEKFKKLRIILSVRDMSQIEYENTKKIRYCTVMLKDSPQDATYFMMNEKYLDKNKRYHFVLNSLYERKENLRDIFCTININGKYFKINFNNF
jgi:cysteinyl-tRNA synthetase